MYSKAILAIIATALSALAQAPWAGIISPGRAIDWRTAGADPAVMSDPRTQCGSTITPRGVGLDDTAIIATAISACTAHHYVLLGPGTFQLNGALFWGSTTVNKSNITLRGSGPMQTILHWNASGGCQGGNTDICILNPAGAAGWSSASAGVQPGNTFAYDWIQGTTGYAQGSTSITLDRTTGLTLGDWLILDQPNDEFGVEDAPIGATESGNTVTITTKHPHGFSIGQSVYIDGISSIDIDNAVESGTTVTITVTPVVGQSHPFTAGSVVCIHNSGTAGYNGQWTVLASPAPTATTFAFTAGSSGLAANTSGQVDTCYNNAWNTPPAPDTITDVPTPTSFTFTSSHTGLANSGQAAGQLWPATVAVDTGEMLQCQTGGLCRGAQAGNGTEGRLEDGAYRSQEQIVQITGILLGNVITISPGLYRDNWATHGKVHTPNGRGPGAFYRGPSVVGIGIEDLTLNHADSTNSSTTYGIRMVGVYNSWIKNVRSMNATTAHIQMRLSNHNTVMNSYFYGTGTAAGANAYGFLEIEGGDNLVVNNIFQHIPAAIIMGATQGSVIAYNFAEDNFYNVTSWARPGFSLHDTGDGYTLFEGNQMPGFKADYVHGTHALATIFRNNLGGRDINTFNGPLITDTTVGTWPIHLMSSAGRYMNVIGNVLGTSGYHTIYQHDPVNSAGNINVSIYALGWGSTQNNCNFDTCDSAAAPTASTISTLMRWGNYDTQTGTIRWESSEVPSTLSIYSNPVPASQALPASLIFSARPAWFDMVFDTSVQARGKSSIRGKTKIQ